MQTKMPEMKLIVPQFVEMTASYSHKLVPENYGIEGHRFAPLDFFQSYKSQVPVEEATPERLKDESAKLYSMAKADVEDRIEKTLKALRDPQDESVLTAEDLDAVAPFVKMLMGGAKEEEYTKAITESKNKLNEKQLNFLRNLLRTIRK